MGILSTPRARGLCLTLAAALAAGCASRNRGAGTTTTTTSGGDVVQPTATTPGDSTMAGGAARNAGAASDTAASAAAGVAAGAMGVRSDAQILGLLHESNTGEIAAALLAQQKASATAVRDFAARMITDHTRLDQRGSVIAAQEGITPAVPDSSLAREQQQEAAALRQAPRDSFDRTYVTQQVAAHQRTLALVDASIPVARDSVLRTALRSEVRPVVADHLRMAQDLQRQLVTSP